MDGANVVYVAHHALLLAIPAFGPAIAVVAVILYVAIRDRRADARTKRDDAHRR